MAVRKTQILVVNFGSQYIHLIARRIRELGVFTEIVPYDIPLSEIKRVNPKGIIFSGGPSSVYNKNAPKSDPKILQLGIPILGICYGQQLISYRLGANVRQGKKEYGKKILHIKSNKGLLKGLARAEQVWMSHGDIVEKLPNGFVNLASTDTCKNASIADAYRRIYGVQFHPEVAHTPNGAKVLKNFVFEICKAARDYSVGDLAETLIAEVKETVGQNGVVMGLSGGVDSTVAAVLISRAIGKRLHCVFIDHGLIRKRELESIKAGYSKYNLDIQYVDASKTFLTGLKGVTDPEKKRKIIGHTFIRVFEKEAEKLEERFTDIKFLAQGTIYPDRIESAQPSKQADKIKSHHNIALPKKMHLKVLEPLRDLYKDEVRKLGQRLNITDEIINRHPFPGPGLAVRIIGEITDERICALRDADYIFIDELKKSGYYKKTWQAFASLFPIRAVGVMGDARTYGYIISLRAVTSVDAMTADWARLPHELLERISNRILNEVKGVSRVVYDISQKPPATIEYE